jgi:hypothetical protein
MLNLNLYLVKIIINWVVVAYIRYGKLQNHGPIGEIDGKALIFHERVLQSVTVVSNIYVAQ